MAKTIKRLTSLIMVLLIALSCCLVIPQTQADAATLTRPSVTAFSNQNDGIKIRWNSVAGASGYIIYRNGQRIDKVGKTVTYTDTAVKDVLSGKQYKYQVQAYRYVSGGATKSKLSLPLTTMRVKKTSAMSATANGTSVTIKIAAVKNCYFEYYRSTNKTSGYTKIYYGPSTTYTDKNLARGKTYYYKVKSYKTLNGKKVYSPATNPRTVTIANSTQNNSTLNEAEIYTRYFSGACPGFDNGKYCLVDIDMNGVKELVHVWDDYSYHDAMIYTIDSNGNVRGYSWGTDSTIRLLSGYDNYGRGLYNSSMDYVYVNKAQHAIYAEVFYVSRWSTTRHRMLYKVESYETSIILTDINGTGPTYYSMGPNNSISQNEYNNYSNTYFGNMTKVYLKPWTGTIS